MRPTTERYSGSRQVLAVAESAPMPGIAKVILHIRMSRLAYIATVLAHLKADDYVGMRRMTARLPRVRRKKAAQPL